MSTDGLLLHKAIVHTANPVTGICTVRIPALMGGEVVTVGPDGLTKVDGVWGVPVVGTPVSVSSTLDMRAFSWIVGAPSASVVATVNTIVGDAIGSLQAQSNPFPQYATDVDAAMLASHDMPTGGATGTILTKSSGSDYATGWTTRASLAGDSAFTDKFGLQGVGPPAGLGVNGQEYWDLTAKRLYRHDGTDWTIMAEPTISTYVPTVTDTGTGGTSGFTLAPGGLTFRYHRCDGWLDWVASIAIASNGSATGAVAMSFPIGFTTNCFIGSGREDAVTGAMLQVLGASGWGYIYNYANQYPGGTGYSLRLSGRYQMVTRYS